MAIEVLRLLTLNNVRHSIRVFKKHKLKWILGILLTVLFIKIAAVDFFSMFVANHTIVSIVFFIYCIAKLFQEMPIMRIHFQLLEFRLLGLWQLKMLILVKSMLLSSLILTFLLVLPVKMNTFIINKWILFLLMNILINLICFLKSQTKYENVLIVITLLTVSLAYYLHSIIMISMLLVLTITVFVNKKFFIDDRLLPYYESMTYLYQGFVDGNLDMVSRGQAPLTKQKSSSTLNLMEKFYNKGYWFLFAKEISRAIYSYKKVIHASLINFLIGLFTFMYVYPTWVNGISMLGMVFVLDTILTHLNKPEAIHKAKGFYFPYSLRELMKQKYLAHLCILFIPILSSLLVLKYVNPIMFLICVLLLPIKNLLANFSSGFGMKCVVRCLEMILLLACFFNV